MKYYLTCLLILIVLFTTIKTSHANTGKEYVVILHGIARSNKHMEDLSKYLKDHNYNVININYPSTEHNLQELVAIIHNKISVQINTEEKVNFVGYSMGGILVRAVIHKYKFPNLGRVVQLAPPNNGSEVADFLEKNWLYKKIFGPAGQQLTTKNKERLNLLGTVNYDLGIIAGSSSIDPISSLIIPGNDDGKVSIKSTRVQGMKDHIVISASHTFFPNNKTVQQQTLHFLQKGFFKKI